MILRKVKGKLKCNERHCTHSAKYELVANEGLHGIPLCVKHLQVLDCIIQEILSCEAEGTMVQSAYNVPAGVETAVKPTSRATKRRQRTTCKAQSEDKEIK